MLLRVWLSLVSEWVAPLSRRGRVSGSLVLLLLLFELSIKTSVLVIALSSVLRWCGFSSVYVVRLYGSMSRSVVFVGAVSVLMSSVFGLFSVLLCILVSVLQT